jgi:transcriptional regulator with XRE-family HTH domain
VPDGQLVRPRRPKTRPQTVAERVAELMALRGWNLRQLAAGMGASTSEARDVLGGALITTRLAAGLALAFDRPARYFLDLDLLCIEWSATQPSHLSTRGPNDQTFHTHGRRPGSLKPLR